MSVQRERSPNHGQPARQDFAQMTREETLEALRSRSTVTLREAADALGYSSSEAYRAARSGKLRTIRIGRRILVATALLERLITAQDGGER